MQIRQWQIGIAEVTSPFDLSCSPSYQQCGYVVVEVTHAVTQSTAVDDNGLVEQRAASLIYGSQLFQKIGEEPGMKGIHFDAVFDQISLTPVV